MRVAFLANSFHLQETGSSRFFIELLKGWFPRVDVVTHQDVWGIVPFRRYDLIIVWQHLFSPSELASLGCSNLVIVPMYDDCPKESSFWEPYRGHKILCFSSTLAQILGQAGHRVLSVRYQTPPPSVPADQSPGLRAFFWPRTPSWDWRQVGPLVPGVEWESFHLHTGHTPPECALPNADEFAPGKFRSTTWFESKEEFMETLARANVFIAPRRYEGIGMAILEALALGQCVIAPDEPTANEYIVDGVNGYLVRTNTNLDLSETSVRRLGHAARQEAEKAWAAWQDQLPAVQQFLRDPGQPQRRHWGVFLARTLRGLVRSMYVTVWKPKNRTPY